MDLKIVHSNRKYLKSLQVALNCTLSFIIIIIIIMHVYIYIYVYERWISNIIPLSCTYVYLYQKYLTEQYYAVPSNTTANYHLSI